MIEIITQDWLKVPAEYGPYVVSSLGNIVSNSRRTPFYLKKSARPDGYDAVCLYDMAGGKRQFLVHRLVYEVFVTKPKDGMVIMHLDGDKKNNAIENLREGTQMCNVAFQYDDGTIQNGSKHWNSKITEKDAVKISSLLNSGHTQKRIAADMKLSKILINRVANGECWGWLTGRGKTRLFRWSAVYEACISCGTTETKHNGKGLCKKCYPKRYRNDRKNHMSSPSNGRPEKDLSEPRSV